MGEFDIWKWLERTIIEFRDDFNFIVKTKSEREYYHLEPGYSALWSPRDWKNEFIKSIGPKSFHPIFKNVSFSFSSFSPPQFNRGSGSAVFTWWKWMLTACLANGFPRVENWWWNYSLKSNCFLKTPSLSFACWLVSFLILPLCNPCFLPLPSHEQTRLKVSLLPETQRCLALILLMLFVYFCFIPFFFSLHV